MKLIIFDIDGPLNGGSIHDGRHFLPECVAALNKIIYATGAKLVISSTWRGLIENKHMDYYGFGKMLRSWGIRGADVIGHTRPSQSNEPRWMQIRDWLKENRSPDGIRKICILDDDPDAFGGRPGVRTAGGVGLTEADADAAIEILNG